MLAQKIQILPFLSNLDANSSLPLVFLKKVSNGSNQEINCFLQIEARTPQETRELGRELFEIISLYLKDSISRNIFPLNPENLCEEILKIFNQTLFSWGQKAKLQSWSELDIFFGTASVNSFFFSKIGEPRVALFRNQEIILVDEKLNNTRSPHFSSPFNEVTGGNLQEGDKFLILSKKLVQFLSFEEISSLIALKESLGAFFNVVKSIEVIQSPINTSFILGEVLPRQENEIPLPLEIFDGRLKEYNLGENVFTEYNSLISSQNIQSSNEAGVSFSKETYPWKSIFLPIKENLQKIFILLLRTLAFPFKYLLSRTNNLSFFRRVLLFSGLSFFIIFVISVGYFFFNKPEATKTESIDYQAMLDKANQLIASSDSSLLYKDDDKARKELGEADALLQQISNSGDLGIKALKIRKDVGSRIAVLDKTKSASNIALVWSLPGDKGEIKNISLSGGTLALTTSNSVWRGTIDDNQIEFKEDSFKGTFPESKSCLLSKKNLFLLIYPEKKSFYEIPLASKEVSSEKNLNGENEQRLSACAAYGTFLYFWSPEEKQIQQFTYDSSGANFSRNWITGNLKEDFQDDNVSSLTVDGSIFVLTQNGLLLKLSGGKKAPFDFEKPATPFKGTKGIIKTSEEEKNLYLLDPERERIIIFDKETGKSKGQIQDKILSEAVDIEIQENKKEIFFASGKALFKMDFTTE